MSPSCKSSRGAARAPGCRCNAPASSWPSLRGNASRRWPPRRSATRPRSGGFAAATSSGAPRPCWRTAPAPGGPSRFPPLQRAQLVKLACLEPVAKGLRITHWTSQDLVRQAVADGIVGAISARTVRQILHAVDLQPHRTRYWKTAQLDEQFKERAEQVLWCYANAVRLARQGIW